MEMTVQAHIGRMLKAMYDSALREPVPDRFLDLLRQMDTDSDPAPSDPPKAK